MKYFRVCLFENEFCRLLMQIVTLQCFLPLKVVITNYPDDKEEWLEAENNPEDDSAGFRKVPFSKEIYIEKDDFKEEAGSKFFRLKLGGEVRLKNAYIIKAEKAIKDEDGNIIHRGISQRFFSKSFTIANDVEVKGAELKDGLLTVALERIIPEAKKAKTIEIK